MNEKAIIKLENYFQCMLYTHHYYTKFIKYINKMIKDMNISTGKWEKNIIDNSQEEKYK